MNGECNGEAKLKLPKLGTVFGGMSDKCPHCDCATLALYRCKNCGQWLMAGTKEADISYRPARPDDRDFALFTFPSDTTQDDNLITINPRNGEYTGFRGEGDAGVIVQKVNRCPHCYAEHSTDEDRRPVFEPFTTGTPLTLSIVAETVLSELPPFPSPHDRPYLPARGRRLLAFSDSRQEAARLGPRLTRLHETQLVRALIVRALNVGATPSEKHPNWPNY